MPNDHAVACEIERALPIFQTRLIASIQLGRQNRMKKSAMVGALVRETAAMAAGEDFRKVVKMGKLIRALRVLACVLVAAGGLAWLGRGNLTVLLERACLMRKPAPTRTQIEKIDCATRIALGTDLKIDVQAQGVLPPEGVIIARAGVNTSQYRLERDPKGGGEYHAVIRSVQASLNFQARINDTTSEPVAVAVLLPPAVVGVRCEEVLPAYTKLPPRERPTGDLSLLAGSVLRLIVNASGPVKAGTLHLVGPETDLALTVNAQRRQEAYGEIPIPKDGLSGFYIRLVDDDGIASRETAMYRIDIVPDRPPTIKIMSPGKEELATVAATEIIAFRAEDDFGVATVFLHYVANHSPEKTLEFDMEGANPRLVDRRFEWQLEPLRLAPGGSIEYWMEAVDANNVTGPGKGETEHARIRIVTDDEKRTELSGRTDAALGSLDGMSHSEDELAKKLGTRIFQKPGGAPP
jgi:hypothetical protein